MMLFTTEKDLDSNISYLSEPLMQSGVCMNQECILFEWLTQAVAPYSYFLVDQKKVGCNCYWKLHKVSFTSN